eukprot:UN06802
MDHMKFDIFISIACLFVCLYVWPHPYARRYIYTYRDTVMSHNK